MTRKRSNASGRSRRPPRLSEANYCRKGQIVFVTIRAYGRKAPFVRSELNQVVIQTLYEEQKRLDCWVHTYCLMPDHIHFLVSPREEGYSVLKFTNQFKGKTTNRSWRHGWEGKLWWRSYYDRIVRDERHLDAVVKYIMNNPVREGLVGLPSEWPWSGCLSPFP